MRIAIVATLVLLWPARAGAEPSMWESRPAAVNLAVSLWGSPTGPLGATADYAFAPWLSASGGIGLGGAAYRGPDANAPTPLFAVAARFRSLTDAEHATTASLGLSTGNYAQGTFCVDCSPDGDTVWVWNPAYWADFAVGYELRSEAGLAFQVNVGAEYLLNSESDACYKMSAAYGGHDYTPCRDEAPLHHIVFPFAQATIGHAF